MRRPVFLPAAYTAGLSLAARFSHSTPALPPSAMPVHLLTWNINGISGLCRGPLPKCCPHWAPILSACRRPKVTRDNWTAASPCRRIPTLRLLPIRATPVCSRLLLHGCAHCAAGDSLLVPRPTTPWLLPDGPAGRCRRCDDDRRPRVALAAAAGRCLLIELVHQRRPRPAAHYRLLPECRRRPTRPRMQFKCATTAAAAEGGLPAQGGKHVIIAATLNVFARLIDHSRRPRLCRSARRWRSDGRKRQFQCLRGAPVPVLQFGMPVYEIVNL
uniref:Endo/exonuclease/phosphatase domain-containing protein n=1 Tax=Macrostomum lignano TaxID=282301 RepID=A0A1I8FDQ2_9PLAT